MEVAIIDERGTFNQDGFAMPHPGTKSWHVYDFFKVIKNNYHINNFPVAAYGSGNE